jgi:hypothetical protein
MSERTQNNPQEADRRGAVVGEIRARREEMADGKRYIVYYTFGEETESREKLTKQQGGIGQDV